MATGNEMLNREFNDFYHNWRAKADELDGVDVRSAFDRFFTLFVIYNRLYAEATFELARQPGSGVVVPNGSFPDGKAARKYVGQYLNNEHLIDTVENEVPCAEAIQAIVAFLEQGRFFIKLHRVNGTRQPDQDRELLTKLRSNSKDDRAEAVLDFLYSVRCNLFHGHKSFEGIQIEVMRPANTLLLRVIEILFERLNRL
jgi:hypothetical protein